MTGVGIQQLFIILFFTLIVRFQVEVQRFETIETGWLGQKWRWVTHALYAALALITMRIVFRLFEFSAGTGVDNPLPYHEQYALALDAFPMSLAILILAIIHPGLALRGPESEFPNRKERKAEKKKLKGAKKAGFPLGRISVTCGVKLALYSFLRILDLPTLYNFTPNPDSYVLCTTIY